MAHAVHTNVPHYTGTQKHDLASALAVRWLTAFSLPVLIKIVEKGESEFVMWCRLKGHGEYGLTSEHFRAIYRTIKKEATKRSKDPSWANRG